MASFITLFVDNLGQRVDNALLRHKFSDFGVVKDVFIPMKRGKNSGRRFGFVRFDCPVAADIAVEKANGIRLLGNIIYVKHAAFNKNGFPCNKPGVLLSQGGIAFKPPLNCSPPIRSDTRIALDNNIVLGSCPSYAEVVSGSLQRQIPRVQACDEGNELLSRSAVGRLSAMRDLDSLLEAFISEGVTNIQLRDLGGTSVLLSFESVEHMSSMLEGSGLCWLRNWFVEVNQWSPDFKLDLKRVVWISCYGVPLHLWNANTFFNIGNLWGESISLDDATSNGSSFSVGRVKILTNVFEEFNHLIDLDINGKLYPVRVIEEHSTINYFSKASCSCKGCGIDYVVSYPRPFGESDSDTEKEDDFLEDGDKDLSREVASDGVHIEISKDDVELSLHSINNSVIGDSCSPTGVDQVGQVLEPSAEDCMGLHSLFLETHDIEIVEKSKSLEEVLEGSDFDASDLISNEPLFKYVEHKRHKKSHKRQKKSHIAKKDSLLKEKVSSNIHQRNSILVKEARENMKRGVRLGVKFHGRESFNIKKLLELQGINISEQIIKAEIKALDLLEDDASISLEF